MSALEETVNKAGLSLPAEKRRGNSLVSRFLKTLSSVRFGVFLLILLGAGCMVGMLVMQENVQGFDNYYNALTPAQRLVYGRLDFFDIYNAWYFNALLGLLSINIILSSIERFPKTWKMVAHPNVAVPVRWIRDQKPSDSIEITGDESTVRETVETALKGAGWRRTKTAEKGGKTFVFAESGAWNRLGAYPVHVGLLTIFLGAFLTGQLGSNGQMPLTPGQTTDLTYETVFELDQVNQVTKKLPFEIACTDIEQKLIRNADGINAGNTIDWVTRIVVRDETGETEGTVQMNRPFDYRGYRFFQASYVPVGRARNVTLTAASADGSGEQEIRIPRGGEASLADGTRVKLTSFRGKYSTGPEDPNEDTSGYPNPAAVLQVVPPGSPPQTAYAFGPKMADIPIAKKPVAGYTFRLIDFEKVGDQHILAVQRDPGANVVYIGFALLCLTLAAVFFFAHQRVWAAIEPIGEGRYNVIFGGNTNRSPNAFEEKFARMMNRLRKANASNQINI